MKSNSLVSLFAVALGAAVATTGCAARISAEPEPVYLTADTVPTNVETYPSVDYEGHPNYYVNGRWYYRHGSSWVYYRSEPSELARRRPAANVHREEPRQERREDRKDDRHDHDDNDRRR